MCEQTILRSMWLIGMDQTRLTWLNLVTPAPFISDGAAHFGIFAEMLCGLQNEHIAASPTEVATSLPLASARKPNVLSAFPSVAARIAEGFPEAALVETRRRFQEKKNLANLAAMLLARFKGIRVRDIIKLRYGIFSGESLAPYRQTIIDHYGLEPYEVYACTEFLCFNVECRYHCGIHIWLDACIAEIIPQPELDKEENTAGYIPQALFLDEVPIGTMGEYVLTTFGEALPLVRYRTSDLLEVVGTERCRVRTDPPTGESPEETGRRGEHGSGSILHPGSGSLPRTGVPCGQSDQLAAEARARELQTQANALDQGRQIRRRAGTAG